MDYDNNTFRGFTTSARIRYEEGKYQSVKANVPWTQADDVSRTFKVKWEHGLSTDKCVTKIRWQHAKPTSVYVRNEWGSAEKIGTRRIIPWNKVSNIPYNATSVVWNHGKKLTLRRVIPWDGTLAIKLKSQIRWQVGKYRSCKLNTRWEVPNKFRSNYNSIPWEEAIQPPCGKRPEIPPVEPPRPEYMGEGDLDLMCTMDARPHWEKRGLLALGSRFPCMGLTVVPEVYNNMANVKLTRVDNGANIGLLSASIGHDFETWGWKFNATLSNAQALALAKPINKVKPELELEINGYYWRVQVDTWSRSKAFVKEGWTVSGTSISGELSGANALPTHRVEGTTKTAQQIALDELFGTGWALEWNAMDWSVLPDTYSYESSTRIQAIKQVAEAVGARVLTKSGTARILRVIPRYDLSPWAIAAATPDQTIPFGVIRSSGSTWQSRPKYDSVVVSGQEKGVVVVATRDGTAGQNVAPMVINPLMADNIVATERGRQEIASGGEWELHRLELPISANVPLVVIGSLVEVLTDTGSWKGVCTGVNITSNRTIPIKVNQSVVLEEYHDS